MGPVQSRQPAKPCHFFTFQLGHFKQKQYLLKHITDILLGLGHVCVIAVFINKYFIKNLPDSVPCLFVRYVPCTSAVHQRPPCLLTIFLHEGWGRWSGGSSHFYWISQFMPVDATSCMHAVICNWSVQNHRHASWVRSSWAFQKSCCEKVILL